MDGSRRSAAVDRMGPTLLLIGLVALSLAVWGCGGDDGDAGDSGDAEADALVEVLGDQIWSNVQEDVDEMPFELTRSDAGCLAQAFVDNVGYEDLSAAGITAEAVRQNPDLLQDAPDSLEIDAAAVFDDFENCVDFADLLAPLMAEDMDLSEPSAKCLIEGYLDEDSFRESLVAGIFGDDEAPDPFDDPDPAFVARLFDLMRECLTDDELARVIGS